MTLARSPSQKRQADDGQGNQDDNECGGTADVFPLIAKVIYESLAFDFLGVHGFPLMFCLKWPWRESNPRGALKGDQGASRNSPPDASPCATRP
jgi:hypothetical protein